ncbi:Dehydrogenase (flavoprotein) [Jatrophihabitans endophyticus]|uniref:Dehydrogenase (Flavoprotein) n=1 Tax=Jatrophihabitans endophyticus TaxID=1206085 RepID=A0A1M5Q925_9ACTN|nr:NAD(P)/FAD-dependent oxidoreductase [Jatrophihabitans endophyticus]SHH10512.1 Dehydrogenase (flavoprotein) [Jatrophihabitans endophyticus]
MSADVTAAADVVVVGARCAGASLAVHLARAGVRVRLLDKARFPSDTASTHIVQPRGTAALTRLGVADRLRAAGAAAIERLALRYDDVHLEAEYADARARPALSTGTTPGLSLRRTALDAILVDAARDAGAQVCTRTAVTGLLRDGTGRVCGVRTATGDIAAGVVVGADGRDSTVARLVGARRHSVYAAPRLAAWVYLRGARDDAGRLRIGRIGSSALIAVPAEDGLQLVGVVPSVRERTEFLADRDDCFERELRRWPELHELVAGAERVGPMRVVPDWQAYFRTSAGPGWVLSGDAGHFKDPAAAQGITDALRQAEWLASSLAASLPHGARHVDAATRDFARRRDDDCREMHWFAHDMGAAGPTGPLLRELVRGIARDDPMLFARVLNRDLAPSEVVTAGRLAHAAGAALRGGPGMLVPLGREVASVGRRRTHRALARAARGRGRKPV